MLSGSSVLVNLDVQEHHWLTPTLQFCRSTADSQTESTLLWHLREGIFGPLIIKLLMCCYYHHANDGDQHKSPQLFRPSAPNRLGLRSSLISMFVCSRPFLCVPPDLREIVFVIQSQSNSFHVRQAERRRDELLKQVHGLSEVRLTPAFSQANTCFYFDIQIRRVLLFWRRKNYGCAHSYCGCRTVPVRWICEQKCFLLVSSRLH